jgi:uncharacterized C2H2 Zn-finger protein
MKRKTNFKLMYLVDTTLFNKLNNVIPSSESKVWVKNVVNNKQPFLNSESQLEPIKTGIQPKTDFAMQTKTPLMTNAITETEKVNSRNKRTGMDNIQTAMNERMDVDTNEQCMECDDSLPLPTPPQIQALPSPPTTKMIQLQTPLLPIAGPSQVQTLHYIPVPQEVLPQAPTHRMVQYQPSFHQQPLPQPPRLEMIQPTSPQLALPPPMTTPVLQHQRQLPLPSPSQVSFTSPNTQLSLPDQPREVVKNQYKNYYEYSKFICTLCNTEFGTEKALQRHMKNIHDAYEQEEKGIKHAQTFTCDICYTEFKSQKGLDRHVDNIHGAFSQEKKGHKRKLRKKNPTPHKYVKFM